MKKKKKKKKKTGPTILEFEHLVVTRQYMH